MCAQQLLLVYTPSCVTMACITCLKHVRRVGETWPHPGDFSYSGGVHVVLEAIWRSKVREHLHCTDAQVSEVKSSQFWRYSQAF